VRILKLRADNADGSLGAFGLILERDWIFVAME